MEDSQEQNNNEESYVLEPEEEEGKGGAIKKDKLKQEIERLKKEKEEYLQGWQRERASFVNFRKDEDKRFAEFSIFTNRNTLISLISLSDIFRILSESAPQEIQKSTWFKGFELTEKRLEKILLDHGAQEFSTKEGDVFDPNFHEAIDAQESEKPSGTILRVVHKGYMLGEKVLRATGVIVAK